MSKIVPGQFADDGSVSLSITLLTDGSRAIHLTDGRGNGALVLVGPELFAEMRKVMLSDGCLVEVSNFTKRKCLVMVEGEGTG